LSVSAAYYEMHIKGNVGPPGREEGGSVGRPLLQARFDSVALDCSPWRLMATGGSIELLQVPSVFAIGNGFIGVRGPGDPSGAPRVYLNGVYERMPIAYHEAAFGYASESDVRLAVADATRPVIAIDGVGVERSCEVELDFASGLRTEKLDAGGRTVRIEQFASMTRTGLVAIRVTAPPGVGLDVKPQVAAPPNAHAGTEESVYDPRLPPQLNASPWREVARINEGGLAGRVDQLPVSGFQVAAFAAVLAQRVGENGESVVELLASYAVRRHDDPARIAREAIEGVRQDGFEALLREQRDWWRSHWSQAEIDLPNEPAAEGAVRHALLQLTQAAARDGTGSVAAKGQTGEGYEGHIFWDADLYVLPVFAWTRPDIAREMLTWRIAGLEAARANARAMGQESGALYPWRTIGGRECSSFFPAGSAQYHINADIAFALRTYLDATCDVSILEAGGAEMLAETARIWLQIGFHDPDRGGAFVINRVTGPDEYSAIVDNNLYTNLMAAEHLRFAASHGLVDPAEAEAMERAADAMFLPFDSDRGVYAQDETFFSKQPWPFETTPADRYPLLLHYHPLTIFRHQVAKQADAVLAVALMSEAFEPEVRKRMLDIYEAVTVHDSTLSASAFATAAARSDDAHRAYFYWCVTALTDLADLFGNSGHGLHMAALAGSWTAMVFGFAGLRVEEDCVAFDPIRVPALGSYAFSLRFRQTQLKVTIREGEACYERLNGPALKLRHSGEKLTLSDLPIVRPIIS
jgi:trehalose/maltose hydrolase-like predicted phosphorylase